MSSGLNNLIEKLAGANSSSTVAESVDSAQTEQSVTDPVYVEKLASAVDFIVDNMDSFSEPDKKDTSDNKQIIKEALSRDPTSGRFVSDTPKIEEPPKVESSNEEVASVTDIADKIRERLKAHLAEKQETAEKQKLETEQADEANKELLQSVLGKLKELKSDKETSEPEVADKDNSEETENFYGGSKPDPVSEEEIFNVGETVTNDDKEEVSNEANSEAAEKAASAGQSLADVLNAALSSDEQNDESVPQDTKTASVHGSEGPLARKQATDNLKKKLLAKIGKEA